MLNYKFVSICGYWYSFEIQFIYYVKILIIVLLWLWNIKKLTSKIYNSDKIFIE